MDEDLLPCPFCGSGETEIREEGYWTGLRTEVLGIAIYHWCERQPGDLSSVLKLKSKTREQAVARWNRRAQI